MPGTKRTPIGRRPGPRVTPRAVDLFERVMRLKRRQAWSPEIRDLSVELDAELGMMPWSPDVLSCDEDEPRDDMSLPMGIEDFHRSRAVRLELEAAVRARHKAAREARRNGGAPTPPT